MKIKTLGYAALTLGALASANSFAITNGVGSDLSNTASLTYTVSGASGTPASNTSNDTSTFKVDKKIDFSLTEIDATGKVFAGLLATNEDRVYTFQLVNEGNADQVFGIQEALAAYALGDAALNSDLQDFQLGNVNVYIDTDNDFSNGATLASEVLLEADTYQAAAGGTFTAGDDRVYVHIEADQVPDVSTSNYRDKNADTEITYNPDLVGANSYTLVTVFPKTALGGTRITSDDRDTTFDEDTVQTVFADTDTDGFGQELIDAVFTLESAYVSLEKTYTLLTSNITGYTGSVQHLIPGATVRYTLTATNEGELAADSIVITDNFSAAGLTYVPASLQLNGATANASNDPDNGVIVVNVGSLDQSGGTKDSHTITFEATIN